MSKVQCVECSGFRMSLKSPMYRCMSINRTGYSPSPTFKRECNRFEQANQSNVIKRRNALRSMGSIAA